MDEKSKGLLIVIAIAAALVIALAWLKRRVSNLPTTTAQAVTNVVATVPDKVINGINAAADSKGNAIVPSYSAQVSALPDALEAMVRAGTILTPSAVLSSAYNAGGQFKAQLVDKGLLESYEALPTVPKALVAAGQSLGNLVGVDIIGAGAATGQFLAKSVDRTGQFLVKSIDRLTPW